MTDDHDPRLRWLISDAVSEIEPRDVLPEIRSRTQEDTMSSSPQRPWVYAVTGALLAAAVIVAVFLIGNLPGGSDDPTPVADDSPTSKPTKDKPTKEPSRATATITAPPSPEAPGTEEVTAVYYVGDTRGGPRLFREFQPVTGTDPFTRALAGLQEEPIDPDYRSLWPEGSLVDVSFDGTGADGVISVSIADASLRAIPQGVDEATARAAIEQVVYTLQGAAQARAAVQFRLDGNPVDQVYGVPTSEPLANGPVLETLSLMSVTSPEQGAMVGDSLQISGVANSFEANVVWQIQDDDGKVVEEGFVTAEGWMAEKLFPWSDTVDLSELAPGAYYFAASTDDPSGGAEGNGPATDTKNFTLD